MRWRGLPLPLPLPLAERPCLLLPPLPAAWLRLPASTSAHPFCSPLAVLQVLAANGFLYDASLIENPEGESISKGLGARLWPYSMQDGIPQNCEECVATMLPQGVAHSSRLQLRSLGRLRGDKLALGSGTPPHTHFVCWPPPSSLPPGGRPSRPATIGSATTTSSKCQVGSLCGPSVAAAGAANKGSMCWLPSPAFSFHIERLRLADALWCVPALLLLPRTAVEAQTSQLSGGASPLSWACARAAVHDCRLPASALPQCGTWRARDCFQRRPQPATARVCTKC